jgi:hypothetical protein
VLLSLAYSLDLEIEQFDIVIACLNADVAEDIYMHPPPGLNGTSVNGQRLVCKLKRSLYGIKYAPRSWQALLSSWLLSYGFCQGKADPTVYTLLKNDQFFALAVYVDECLLIGRNCQFLVEFKQYFSSRLKIEDLGPASWILGCSIIRDMSRGSLSGANSVSKGCSI